MTEKHSITVAIEAIKLNAALNNIKLHTSQENFIGQMEIQQDLILLGDMFYDDAFTDFVLKWVKEMHRQGKKVPKSHANLLCHNQVMLT